MDKKILAQANAVCEMELRVETDKMSAHERRRLAQKLARWARQLENSALILAGEAFENWGNPEWN